MSVILTQKYSHLVEKQGLDRVFHIALSFFPLLIDVAKSGKLREIISFGIWEVRHTLGLFPKSQYIVFDENEPLVIKEGDVLGSLDFSNSAFKIERTQNWKVSHRDSKEIIFGCLASEDNILYKSVDAGKSIDKVQEFERGITSIYITAEDIMFVNTWGKLYKSTDNGDTFELSLELTYDDSYIFHHNGMTQLPNGELLIGEYGNVPVDGAWANIANIYASSDLGESWEKSDFLKKQGINKHVHLIKYSKLLNKIVLADGDNKKKLWLSGELENFDLKTHPWKLVNKFHIQMGGYTSAAESDSKMILGTDYLGGTNFLVETRDGKKYKKRVIPDPYRRSPLMDLVRRVSTDADEIWAVLNNPISSNARCLLMCTKNGGESWSRVVEYDGTKNLILINSGSTKPRESISFAITSYEVDGGKKGVCYEIK
jgi:hypothetical protein